MKSYGQVLLFGLPTTKYLLSTRSIAQSQAGTGFNGLADFDPVPVRFRLQGMVMNRSLPQAVAHQSGRFDDFVPSFGLSGFIVARAEGVAVEE